MDGYILIVTAFLYLAIVPPSACRTSPGSQRDSWPSGAILLPHLPLKLGQAELHAPL